MKSEKMMEKVNNQMADRLSMSVPSKPEYVSVMRLTASAMVSRLGFNVDQIEDIKVALAEACTNAIRHGLCENNENFNVEFHIQKDRITIDVTDRGNGFCCENVAEPDLLSPKEGGLGIFIIRSLMDEVEVSSDIGKGTTIKMTKYLGDDI